MVTKEVFYIIVLATLIFLIAPTAIIMYVGLYNTRKKKHAEEKKNMEQLFDNELIKSQLEVREQTLQTVAAELHDNIGQILSLTSITLSFIDPANPHDYATKLQYAEELVQRSVSELRQLSQLLYGKKLLDRGLAVAIQAELDWLQKTGRYMVNFDQTGFNAMLFSGEKEVVFFRLFQEIINNIIKHANATRVDIILETSTGQLMLSVADNGKGFEPDFQAGAGLGLHNIKKRVALMGGTVNIYSTPGEGTKFDIIIPNHEQPIAD